MVGFLLFLASEQRNFQYCGVNLYTISEHKTGRIFCSSMPDTDGHMRQIQQIPK